MVHYGYDEGFERTVKDTGTTKNVYVNQYSETEDDGTSNTQRSFVYAGGMKVAKIEGSTITFNHIDHLSGSNVSTDTSGAVVEINDYYPYGDSRIEDKTGSYSNDYLYTGQERDEETGQYYYGARYYNPVIGRFTGIDPWGGDLPNPQSFNKYSYVVNNPLKYTDPTGMYNEETGEIEKGDTSESITKSVNETFGIETTWDDIAEASFLQDRFDTTDPSELVGKSTRIGTNYVKEATPEIDYIMGYISVELSFFKGCGLLCTQQYGFYFANGAPFDLINRQGDDHISQLFGGSSKERTNWAYIYNGDLIRYDAPGNIVAGYGAAYFGINQKLLHGGASLEAAARSAGKALLENGDWSAVLKGDDPVDAKYIDRGYCTYITC